ncbi:hypothetical protein Hanom_Chr04g00281501 [Helianthus anomalus]
MQFYNLIYTLYISFTDTKKDTVSSSISFQQSTLIFSCFSCHDEIGQNNVTLVIRDNTRVKMMEVNRKSGHATQAHSEGSLVFTHVV